MAKTTITLPSFGLTDPGADKNIMWDDSASALTITGMNGITMVDSWRLSTNATNDVDPFSANLERNDTAGFSHLVGMSVSQSFEVKALF